MTQAPSYAHLELVGMDDVDLLMTAKGEAVAAHFFLTVGIDPREAWGAYEKHAECLPAIGLRTMPCSRLEHALALLFRSAEAQAIEYCLDPTSTLPLVPTRPLGAKLRLVLRSHPQTFPPGFTVMGYVSDDHGLAHTAH